MMCRWSQIWMVGLALLAPAVRAAEVPLTVDAEHSSVTFAAHATGHGFEGALGNYEAALALDPAAGRVTRAVFRFKVADLTTHHEKRDHEMQAWLEPEKQPQAEFTLDRLEPGAAGVWQAHGTLLLHGTTHEITFPITVKTEGGRTTIDGTAELDHRQWSLPVIRKFGLLKVDPVVTVHFHLEGTATTTTTTAAAGQP